MKGRPFPRKIPARDDGDRPREHVLLVGSSTNARRHSVVALVGRGYATMICEGPPGCPLQANDRCALLDAADAVVIMPTTFAFRDVEAGIASCVTHARHPIIVEPSVLAQLPLGADVARSADTTRILRTVETALHGERRSSTTSDGA